MMGIAVKDNQIKKNGEMKMSRTKKKIETPADKETAVKAVAQEQKLPVEEVYLQFGDAQWNISDCKGRAAAAYAAGGHTLESIQKLAVYLKPEEHKAYYVVNDSENGSVDL